MTVQQSPTVVCDGWTKPQHQRLVLKPGDPEQLVSHGMCPACIEAMERATDEYVESKKDPRR